ncbi:hypothetical protein WN944_014351 [Citrus x changshan-huyou]|uniref:Uncharacterized protein n=1 Tax=Citrus x changshan-huyou TaxID=2935761 RepID=A0AAP0M5I0_9ROSI
MSSSSHSAGTRATCLQCPVARKHGHRNSKSKIRDARRKTGIARSECE